ncbi:glycosyltransferase family 4 protein [Chitinophagales bacterium]|nr:glycosyltransferase family 4 protein [Chitinophagales bacterium]
MRILQLCKKSPTPQIDGESIAIHQISKSIVAKGHQLDILAMLTEKHAQYDVQGQLDDVSYSYVRVPAKIRALGAFKSIFSKTPYIIERFYSQEFLLALIQQLNKHKYDIIICEGVFLGPYLESIRNYSAAKVVLRAHNVEHVIWKRLAASYKNGLKRFYLRRIMVPQYTRYEEEVIQEMDALIPISPVDEAYFQGVTRNPIKCIPVALDIFEKAALPSRFSVGFLGGLDWQPNVDGVKWFLKEVWKPFVADGKNVQLQIAGRNTPKEMFSWDYNKVTVLGEVASAQAFLNSQSVIIVPLFSGSGMRVKIIEAMAFGKCILSTTIGAEGINCVDDEHILLSEYPQDWIRALEDLMTSSERVNRIGFAAKKLAEQEYCIGRYTKDLDVFLQGL